VIASAALMTLLATVVAVAVVRYQQKQQKHAQEVEQLKASYRHEVLSARLEMKEQTLHTVSQEIHDNIGQVLSLVRLHLNRMKPEGDEALAQRIGATNELVGKVIQDLRDLSKSFNTEYIQGQFLSEAFAVELNKLQRTGAYETRLRVDGQERMLDPQKQLLIFRVAQEAFQNSIKHAEATQLTVELHYSPVLFKMHIRDNGAGFDFPALQATGFAGKGTGIRNMFYRSRVIGGEFAIDSRSGEGTGYTLTLPT